MLDMSRGLTQYILHHDSSTSYMITVPPRSSAFLTNPSPYFVSTHDPKEMGSLDGVWCRFSRRLFEAAALDLVTIPDDDVDNEVPMQITDDGLLDVSIVLKLLFFCSSSSSLDETSKSTTIGGTVFLAGVFPETLF